TSLDINSAGDFARSHRAGNNKGVLVITPHLLRPSSIVRVLWNNITEYTLYIRNRSTSVGIGVSRKKFPSGPCPNAVAQVPSC
ncbi:saccharopine dehydrogenase (nadp+ l-glutamate-forming), partial [Moniliophthora roreri]